ncbi:hypothetical protein Trydic_g9758 [Trypoxylus dichotomus]
MAKRETTKREDRLIAQYAKKEPFAIFKQIKDHLHLTLSTVTIRGRLGEADLNDSSPRKVPLPKKHHIHNPINFAKYHLQWPARKWRNILWSNESKVVFLRRLYVGIPPNSDYKPQHSTKIIQQGEAIVMI